MPIERAWNPEHFDMRLQTMHLMVPEILTPKSPCFLMFFNQKMSMPLEPLNQYLGNHKVHSLETHIKMLRISSSFDWHRFRSKIWMFIHLPDWVLPQPVTVASFPSNASRSSLALGRQMVPRCLLSSANGKSLANFNNAISPSNLSNI